MSSPSADIVLHGGRLFVSGPTPQGCGLAAGGGRILYAGPDAGLKPFIAKHTEIINLQGCLVLPGFHDSHAHPVLGGLDLAGCALTGPGAAEDYLWSVREFACRHPGAACLRGSGWLYTAFPPQGPEKSSLDAAACDIPVYLKAIDGHTAWVNSKALALAGISAATGDPPGGHIERTASGEPTGCLRELAAMHLVEDRLPAYQPQDYVQGCRLFMQRAAALGITSVYDAMALPEYLAAYRELDRTGGLTLHVHCAQVCPPEAGPEHLELLRARRSEYAGARLHLPAVKFFLDGVVEGHTALLLEPYADRPGFSGLPIWNPGRLRDRAAELDRSGFQLHFHAVGDAAVRLALDAIEQALQTNGRRDSRHQISHCDLIDEADLGRFARLGVIANMQPAWFYRDANFTHSTLPFLGPARAERLYRLASLLETGALVTCGSDWPVGGEIITLNPLDSMQIGMSRLGLGQVPGGNEYLPGESVNLWSMIDFYTSQAALASFQEKRTGSLEAGKLADFIVLDRNLFELPVPDLHRAHVLLTAVQGEIIYRDRDF